MAALRSALTVLAAIALIAPAAALGQAAAGEYDQATLPQAGDDYQIPTGDQSAGGTASPTGQSDDGPGAGSSSGGDGGTILLVALAVVAAGCVGVAAWRLRRGGGSGLGRSDASPPITQGSTGESRTL